MPRTGPKHVRLLTDPDLRRWHQNVAQGSQITADVYLRRLGAFCIQVKVTPRKLISLREANLHGILIDFVASETKRGRTGSYIQSTLKAVRSWLSHNGIRVMRPIKIRAVQSTPTLQDERVPSQEELRRILMAAPSKDRISCVAMAHSGVRPEVIGNYLGTDGLRLKDFPELRLNGKSVEFSAVPTLVTVRAELSKSRNKYFTFLSEEGCSYVRSYLEERMRSGEELGPESDLVAPKSWSKAFVRTTNVGDGIRQSIRKAGFNWRPYVLRAYFDTQLLLAESKGKLAHDYRVFWMGHKGSMEARYTTNKGRLPKELIEDMRAAYARCEPFLSTIPTKGAQDSQANIAKVMLMGLGYTDEELADKDLLDPQVFQQLVKDKMASAAPRQRQKLVEAEELPRYLEGGWTVVTALNGHQVVLNPP